MPPGWSSDHLGLPEMTLPTESDLAGGYEGDMWIGKKQSWSLEVRWRGDQAKFHCHTFKAPEEAPREAKVFDYPHEVVEWLSLWFAQLMNVKD